MRLISPDAASLVDRCRMFALRMPPEAFFSHSTAALLFGAPLPLEIERSALIHVAVPSPRRAPHVAGVAGHKLRVIAGDVVIVRELRATSPARTWCDLAGTLPLSDVVAIGDYLIHWRLPLCSRADLTRAAANFEGQRGMKVLRRATSLLSDRAESRPESKLRVIIALAGLPAPLINRDIVVTEDGVISRTDFEFVDFGFVLEYQGDYHRTKRDQWRKDMTRRARLEATGRQVMEINADDLHHPAELAERIRSVLIRRGWRP
jgi:very-short-patch-repair endonuclease